MTEVVGMYRDRADAGSVLAAALEDLAGRDVVVLGLPRGGVPVAAPVAERLGAPLDVLAVRKVGLPGFRELAMGAVAGVGAHVEVFRNEHVLSAYRVPERDFSAEVARESGVLRGRAELLRAGRPPVPVAGRVVVLVDDGLATGSTMLAALRAVGRRSPERVVVAAPVGSPQAVALLLQVADDVVCPLVPDRFSAVGEFYLDFSQTGDDEVRELISRQDGVSVTAPGAVPSPVPGEPSMGEEPRWS